MSDVICYVDKVQYIPVRVEVNQPGGEIRIIMKCPVCGDIIVHRYDNPAGNRVDVVVTHN